jgi:adenylate cyclase
LANCVAGTNLVWNGQPKDGRALLETGLRLSPRDPVNPLFVGIMVVSYYFDRDYGGTVEAAKRALAEWPDFPHPYRWLAAALGQLGRVDEAREALRKAYATAPWTVEMFARGRPPYVSLDDSEHIRDGFRKAGWEG